MYVLLSDNIFFVVPLILLTYYDGAVAFLLHTQVRVKNLKVLDNKGWALMREGEAEKQVNCCASE